MSLINISSNCRGNTIINSNVTGETDNYTNDIHADPCINVITVIMTSRRIIRRRYDQSATRPLWHLDKVSQSESQDTPAAPKIRNRKESRNALFFFFPIIAFYKVILKETLFSFGDGFQEMIVLFKSFGVPKGALAGFGWRLEGA